MRRIFIMLAFLVGTVGNLSAQMVLFKGTFEEASKRAKEEKKNLFVDFYADWCGPCKAMATQIFILPEVGDYFNEHFICVQVDVEAKGNVEVSKKYDVKVLPTMVFISREGKELRRVQGVMQAEVLIKEAKIALGEELSFEQLYEQFKKKKKDLVIHQQLLLEAPLFISTQQGYDRQKWASRIESLFPDYLKNKKLENMVNEKDFNILNLYHSQVDKNDPIFDFVAENYDKFAVAVGKEATAGYLIGLNNGCIIRLCQNGDIAYKERLKRVDGDLKEVYSTFSFGSLSVLEAITLLADATYNLYRHNEDSFFENMDKYFSGKGESVELSDYTQALEDLFVVYEGKMSEKAYTKCVSWIGKALEKNEGTTPEVHVRLLIMLGQCYQNTGDREHAKQSFNQAFLASTQIENKMMMQQLQHMIQQSLQDL